MRRSLRWPAALLLGALLAGCAPRPQEPAPPPPPRPASAAARPAQPPPRTSSDPPPPPRPPTMTLDIPDDPGWRAAAETLQAQAPDLLKRPQEPFASIEALRSAPDADPLPYLFKVQLAGHRTLLVHDGAILHERTAAAASRYLQAIGAATRRPDPWLMLVVLDLFGLLPAPLGRPDADAPSPRLLDTLPRSPLMRPSRQEGGDAAQRLAWVDRPGGGATLLVRFGPLTAAQLGGGEPGGAPERFMARLVVDLQPSGALAALRLERQDDRGDRWSLLRDLPLLP